MIYDFTIKAMRSHWNIFKEVTAAPNLHFEMVTLAEVGTDQKQGGPSGGDSSSPVRGDGSGTRW